MAIVRFKGYGEVEVPVGTSILKAAQQLHAPEGSACGGVCACSTCHVYVSKGAELLSEQEDDEADILDKAFDVRAGSRLGCQSKIERDGVLEVEITRESVQAYENEHPEARGKFVQRPRQRRGLSAIRARGSRGRRLLSTSRVQRGTIVGERRRDRRAGGSWSMWSCGPSPRKPRT